MPADKNILDKIGRISPHSIEAEEGVLGCMLINSESVPKAIQLIDSKSFYNSNNAIVFNNMVELFEKNKNIHKYIMCKYLKNSVFIYKDDPNDNYLIVCKNQTCSNKIKTLEELKSVENKYVI